MVESKRRNIGTRLGILARVLRNGFDRQTASLNVTRSQWAMIVVVSRRPGASQREIAETLEMSEASAGRLVDRLCADGLLERRLRKDDRRTRAVFLTDQATPLLDDLTAIAEKFEARMFEGFSEDELDKLADYVERVRENVARG